MTTPIQVIYDFLDACGMFDEWEDAEGETQDAITVQMRYLDENSVGSDKMILLIKQTGGSTDRFVSEPVFTFAVMTKVDQADVYAESYANLLYAVLYYLDNAVNYGITTEYESTHSGFLFNALFDYAMMMNIEGPAGYAEKQIQKIYDAITTLSLNESCIISADPITAVNGAYRMSSGRFAYDTEWALRVDSGRFF